MSRTFKDKLAGRYNIGKNVKRASRSKRHTMKSKYGEVTDSRSNRLLSADEWDYF